MEIDKMFLSKSLFYPASGLDGSIIEKHHKSNQNFVYCDYGIAKEEVEMNLDTFNGYSAKYREFDIYELFGDYDKDLANFKEQVPTSEAVRKMIQEPFAFISKYTLNKGFDDNHGPENFQLLYLCTDGVLTYKALYWQNKCAPKILAIKNPGTGFGGNWTDFRKKNSPFGRAIKENLMTCFMR